jgi:TRAP-type C4-dicarboxylate transport system substrate-binding protein
MHSRLARFVVSFAMVGPIVAAGCSQAGTDKAGGEIITLRLASIDEVNSNGQSYGVAAFVEQLGAVSGGRLKVELTTDYGGGSADAESKLVKGIADGTVDGGWPATRAFGGAGIAGLAVVEAPLMITTYAAEKAVVSGPVAGKLLARLSGSGVVGLGLAVGPLRRPMAEKAPLLGPEDWHGATFRVYNSAVQADTVRALGGTPLNRGFEWVDEVRAGKLRGIEFDVAQYHHNGVAPLAGNINGNVVLWPKVYVFSLSKKRYDTLTERQRGWVRKAAAQATKVSVDATYDETSLARELCARGARFPEATPAQLSALQAAVSPVIDQLGTDPADAELLRELQAIARQHPGTDPLHVPADCRGDTAGAETVGAIPTETSSLPAGVYRVEITKADVANAGGDPTRTHPSGTWTLVVKDGRYEIMCRPIADPGDDCGKAVYDGPLELGDLKGSGDTVYFVPNAERMAARTGCKLPVSSELAGHCGPNEPYRMTWRVAGDTLVFSDAIGRAADLTYLSEPWQKIA